MGDVDRGVRRYELFEDKKRAMRCWADAGYVKGKEQDAMLRAHDAYARHLMTDRVPIEVAP